MTFEIIVSQGRVADRTSGAIAGAKMTAEALIKRNGFPVTVVGTPSPPRDDTWSVALAEAVTTLKSLHAATRDVLMRGGKPLLVLNTCGASVATLPVIAAEHPDAVVMWIDAHGDFNHPGTTWSGYLGGMVLAAGCGLWESGYGAGVDPKNVIIVGGRDIDDDERKLLQEANVTVLSPAVSTPMSIMDAIRGRNVWVHIDWDVLQPGFVPAAYSVDEGLDPQDLKAMLGAIPCSQILGIEIAEFEASGDEDADAHALAVVCEILSPLLSTT
ncbi:arginase family protein [Agrobacterium rosae]|uniref:Arginase family protein n=1 Tax=Agrobacterium rosae TaxID=1972867 RepID=A0AAW9FKH0_9HYPH|nr:arginase family protein [Agrobacterium rosae]MDX8305641.1 arginase family protein [Agrobacterium rosae]MDX8332931.1 arginase family protein [Agrobacterium rosae]